MSRVFVTGSEGLIGTAVWEALEGIGWEVIRFDLNGDKEAGSWGDIRDPAYVEERVDGCEGILHLAAVSRVVWGERDPVNCRATNVEGTKNIMAAATRSPTKPWVLFSSSREVYGEQKRLPVKESDELAALNIYGQTKIEGERLLIAGRNYGLSTAIMRLSNVYGSVNDHRDRVVPAFARAGAEGSEMRVDGRSHLFDFTHLEDTVSGIARLMQLLQSGERNVPAIHFVTGEATSLGTLAEMAGEAGGGRSSLREAPERDYDVTKFVGNPSRANEILGWKAEIRIKEGLTKLVGDFAAKQSYIAYAAE